MSDPCRPSSFSHAPFTFSSEDRLFVKSQRPNPHSGVVVATAFAEPTDVSLPDMNNSPIPHIRFLRTLRCSPIAAVFLLFFGMLAQSAIAQATLLGTVTNAATGRTLEGARVTIKGSQIEVTADSQGVYRFDNVTTGNVLLAVSYTGLKTVEVAVAMVPGGVTRQDVGLTADIYRMEKFAVAGEREGLAQAITLQKMSSGVKNVVSTDAFGSIGGNPADLVARLPGVNTTGFEGDTRYVQIRGLNQNLGTVTMDGNRVADAAFAGTSRSYSFQMVSSDAFERIEVVKSPTPDLDGDSIAGAVNMVSKSAFDSSPQRRITGSIGVQWRPFDKREDDPKRDYSLAYSEVFAGKFGISLNAAYRPHGSYQDDVVSNRETLPEGVSRPRYLHTISYRDFRMERIRSGISLKLDYKYSDQTRFFVNAQFNKHIERELSFRAAWASNQAVATVGANGQLTGTGGIVPGYTNSLTEVRPLATSTLTINPGLLYLDSTTGNLSFGGVHRYNTWNIDYDAFRSLSKTYYPGNRAMNMQVQNIGFTFRSEETGLDRFYTRVTQTAGPDVTKLGSYVNTGYNQNTTNGWDRYLGASFNVTKKFATVVPSSIKAGMRTRDQERKLENNSINSVYVGADRVAGLNPATGRNDDDLSLFGQANLIQYGRLARYPRYPFPLSPGRDNELVKETRAAHPEWFQDNVEANTRLPLTGNQLFNENILGTYIQGEINLGKLTILGGVRVETTTVKAQGALQYISPAESARGAAWTGPVTDAEQARRTTAEYGGRQTVNGKYRNVFPGLHFKYYPIKGVVTRLSYATNVGRPAIGTLIPSTNVNDISRTISISNPRLKPQTANNFDLSAEYYFEPAGLISAGVFLKEMKNFIFTSGGVTIGEGSGNGYGGQYAGYNLTTQYNGGSARVRGLELSYTQQFTFLPGFWSGFGLFANYTRLEAEGYYGSGGAISLTNNNTLPTAPTKELAGFVPINANAGVTFTRSGLTVRANVGYRGRFLSSYNANGSLLQYTEPWPTVDLRTSYKFAKHFEAYFDVNNIFNEPYFTRVYRDGLPLGQGLNTPQLLFGVTLRQ